MLPESFQRFALSAAATPIHAIFGLAIAYLTYAANALRGPPDNHFVHPALAACFAGYLFMLWFLWRWDSRQPKMTSAFRRSTYRLFTLVFLYGIACLAIYAGLDGWRIRFVPTQYVGCAVIAVAMAGTFGINIWYGGPLDMRDDVH